MTTATAHRDFLRRVMNFAWGARRCDPARSFADCLRGAWAFCKKGQKAAQRFMAAAKANGGHVRLSADLTRSPIRSTLRGQADAGRKAYAAAYTTALVGS